MVLWRADLARVVSYTGRFSTVLAATSDVPQSRFWVRRTGFDQNGRPEAGCRSRIDALRITSFALAISQLMESLSRPQI